MDAPDRTLSVPLKFVAEITSGGTPKSDSVNWDGDIPFITPPDLNGLDGDLVRKWDRTLTERGSSGSARAKNAVLLSCRAPIGHIGVVMREVTFNQGCKAIAPKCSEDLTYLAHCLVAYRASLQAAGRGTTFTELSTTELSNFAVPWPSPSNRRAIADYLDRETGEIDAMIAKMDELAEQLEVRKQALVRTTIADRARGHGRVPLQALVRIGSGDAIPSERIGDEGGFPVYGGNGPRGFTDDFNQVPDRVLVGRQGALCGNVHVAVGPFWASEHALVLRPYVDDMDLRWLAYATRDLELGRLSTAAAQPGITASGVGRESIPSIAPDEQRRIADHLDEVTGKIDAMLAKVAELRSLLVERRAALITDVVTGRKVVA